MNKTHWLKSLSMAAALTCASGVGAQTFTDHNINYEIYVNGYYRAKVVGAEPGTTSITIPESVEYSGESYPVTLVGDNAFQNNTEITSLTLGNSIESVGNYSFDGCVNLSEIDFGTSVATLWQYAFRGCTALTSVDIPQSLNSFKYGAFDGCTGLNRVDYQGSLNDWASITIQNYNLPANPLYLAHNLYIDGELVTSLEGLSVTKIAACAFAGATCLQGRLDLPAELTTIESQAFSGCTNISGVNFLGTLADWMQRELGGSILTFSDGELYIQGELQTSLEIPETVTKIANYAFNGVTSIKGEVNIPESVTSIGYYAFSGCTGITAVTIGDGATSLGSSAFENCSGLVSATIGDKVSSVPLYCFRGCTVLETITLGSGLTTIGVSAFDGCSALNCELQLPETLTSIGNYAFQNCSGLTGPLVIPDKVTSIGQSAFLNCSSFTSLDLGSGVTTISSQAFKGCSGLKGKLTVPSQVTTLDSYVFQDCSGIEELDLQLTLTSIPSWLFAGCSGLTGTLTVPEGVTTIMTNAFEDCTSLTGVRLPESLVTIGNWAFSGCKGLTGTFVIPDNVTTINQYAFYRCTGIEAIEFGSGVTNLYQGAFYNCEGVKGTLVLPEKITSIPQSCFWQCYGLQGVVIGENVKTIGSLAFDSCDKLESIVCNAVEPPVCGDNAFGSVPRTIPVTVPDESADAYRQASVWQEFLYINPVALESIELSAETTTLKGEKTVQIEVAYQPADASIKTLNWSSSDETVATVADGLVTAHKSGTATITTVSTEDENISAEIEITVIPYVVTYYVDGEEFEAQEYDYGDVIEAPEAPVKRGHEFSGWTGLPETMPAEDITAEAAYDVKLFTLYYNLDGESYDEEEYAYGQTVTPLPDPVKTGYTFSGWEPMPETMPDEDVVTYGFLLINTYKLTIYIDGEIYQVLYFEYGQTIELPEIEAGEGREFEGWSTEIPATMPDGDVEIYGTTKEISGIGTVESGRYAGKVDVYSLGGIMLLRQTDADDAKRRLSPGTYIFFDGKESKKIMVQ